MYPFPKVYFFQMPQCLALVWVVACVSARTAPGKLTEVCIFARCVPMFVLEYDAQSQQLQYVTIKSVHTAHYRTGTELCALICNTRISRCIGSPILFHLQQVQIPPKLSFNFSSKLDGDRGDSISNKPNPPSIKPQSQTQ